MKPDTKPNCSSEYERSDLDWPRLAGATDEVLAGLEVRARRRRITRIAGATAALSVLLIAAIWRSDSKPAPQVQSAPVASSSTLVVVQPTQRVLEDGSIIELRDGAEIRVDFTKETRRVSLERGEAHFAVAKNADWPFIVSAQGVEVRAVGTAFAVQLGGQAIDVLVTEGKVAVQKRVPPAGSVDDGVKLLAAVGAGHFTHVQTEGERAAPEVVALGDEAINNLLSWRIPRLEFSGTPLAAVVEQFNRHNKVQLEITEEKIKGILLSGTLRADRVDALVAMLASDFDVHSERTGDRITLRAGK